MFELSYIAQVQRYNFGFKQDLEYITVSFRIYIWI